MKHSEGLKQFLKAFNIELCHSLSFISNPCISRERLFHFQSSLLIQSNHQHTPQLFHRCWELRRPFFACSADWVEVCVGNVTVELHHLQYTKIIISTMHCDCPHCRINFQRLFLALLSLMKSILIVIVHIIIVITWSTEQTNSPQAGCTISFSWNRGHGFWKASLVLARRRHLVKHHGLPLLSTLEHHKLHVGWEAPDPGIYLAGWEWRWTWAVDYCPDRTAIMEMIMERIFILFIPLDWLNGLLRLSSPWSVILIFSSQILSCQVSVVIVEV